MSNRKDDWAIRLEEELKISSSAHFITLTYNDENIQASNFNPENGLYELSKEDIQNFMKRLRQEQKRYSDVSIRYYLVGEYGEKTRRPHYHGLFFNIVPEVMDCIELIWFKGFVKSGNVETGSINYVLKYFLDVGKKDKTLVLMSRRPGIGFSYLASKKDYHEGNNRFFVPQNGFKKKMPRYYRDKLYTPEEIERNNELLINRSDQEERKEREICNINNDNFYDRKTLAIEQARERYSKLLKNTKL